MAPGDSYRIPKNAEGEAALAELKARAQQICDCGSRAIYRDPDGDLICPICERPKAPYSGRVNGYDKRMKHIGDFMKWTHVKGEARQSDLDRVACRSDLDRAARDILKLREVLPRELLR